MANLKVGSKAWEKQQQKASELKWEQESNLLSAEVRNFIHGRVQESFEGVLSGTMPPNALTPHYVCRGINGPVMALSWVASKEIKRIQGLA